ncbi:MAG: HD domain-containing protein [Deltaproteobacteria bacterium]|nr:HD domain-containing protein [Deltaproteobacteria bacterium]
MTDAPKYRSYSQFEEFLHNFYSLTQIARIHRDNHKLVIEGIEKFTKSINRCMQHESLTFKISNDQLYVEDEKLPYNKTTKHLFDNIVRYFDIRGLEGLHLFKASKQASEKEILTFMRLLDNSRQQPDPLTWLQNGLGTKNIKWVEIIKKSETPQSDKESLYKDKAERRERARRDYTYTMASFQEVTQKITGKRQAGLRKTVRVVQDMTSNLLEDDEVYSAISTLRVFDDYIFTHSVNVAILSMCIGRRLNLSRRSLARLGICALFHDLGKTEIPFEVLNKPADQLDNSELKLMEAHSLNSARLIAKLGASSDSKARLMLPPFEHHLKYNLSGYPHVNWQKSLTLFGRIIAISDAYDTLTSSRVSRRSVLSPDRALGFIFDRAGKDYDPILVKLLINILGLYPVGTLLKLDSGELALVVSSERKKGVKRPLACVLEKNIDGTYQKGETIDLNERDSKTGDYVREIIETYHPSNFGIQPLQHIFSSN